MTGWSNLTNAHHATDCILLPYPLSYLSRTWRRIAKVLDFVVLAIFGSTLNVQDSNHNIMVWSGFCFWQFWVRCCAACVIDEILDNGLTWATNSLIIIWAVLASCDWSGIHYYSFIVHAVQTVHFLFDVQRYTTVYTLLLPQGWTDWNHHRQDKWIEEAGQETGTTEEEKCAWKGKGVEVSLVYPYQYVYYIWRYGYGIRNLQP